MERFSNLDLLILKDCLVIIQEMSDWFLCLGACRGGVMGQHRHLMTSMLTLPCDNDMRCGNEFGNINTHLEYE